MEYLIGLLVLLGIGGAGLLIGDRNGVRRTIAKVNGARDQAAGHIQASNAATDAKTATDVQAIQTGTAKRVREIRDETRTEIERPKTRQDAVSFLQRVRDLGKGPPS